MGKRRNVLGRGLDALIPIAQSPLRELPLDDIIPGRSQPRIRFNHDQLADLARSMEQHGILQPLIVSAADEHGKHRLIAGERRWQAARLARLKTAPVIERDAGNQQAVEIALVENIQRQDLDPLEEASAFQRLIHEHGLTQEEVGQRVGRSRPAIANTLRLLSLPLAVREALIAQEISEGHARALLGAQDSAVIETSLARIIKDSLTVRETERLVAAQQDGQKASPPRRERAPELRALEDRLRQSLGTKVTLTRGRKAGKVVIEYYSDDDLQFLVDKLVQEAE